MTRSRAVRVARAGPALELIISNFRAASAAAQHQQPHVSARSKASAARLAQGYAG
jgi:hypothetical protein